ncbi:MAG: hypothetical protein ACYS0G_03230 [Planctomycetota bacterium]|jgi:Fe-S cluster assembly iron-binding protein IscA
MLTLTDTAGAFLVDLLGEAEAPQEVAVRFVVETEGVSLRLDNERPGDESFSHDGRTVLLLDEEMSTMLTEKTLDVQESQEGPKLTLE